MLTLLIMALCLALNAVFSGIEMAFVSFSRAQLKDLAQQGNRAAERVLSLRGNPERTLSVLQVGITLVGILAAAVGGAGAEESVTPVLESRFGLGERTAEVITILCVTLPYTYLSVVVGELVPKSIALRNPIRVILRASHLLMLLGRFLAPLITVLERSTRWTVRMIRPRAADAASGTAADPDAELDLSGLSPQHRQYVFNLFNLRRRTVAEVLIPWERAVRVDLSQSASEVNAAVLASGHTRIPVVKEGAPVGLLHTKEFTALLTAGSREWQQLVRPALHVQVEDSLLRALHFMQQNRSHLCLVYSGSTIEGIVAMEDIFEEIIGDIYDEDDDERIWKALVSSRANRLPEWLKRKAG